MAYDVPNINLLKERIFAFDSKKSIKLEKERGVGLEKLAALIEEGDMVLSVKRHPNQDKYPHQYICEVNVGEYVYIVPIVVDDKKVFLKTAYPSRKATADYMKRKESA